MAAEKKTALVLLKDEAVRKRMELVAPPGTDMVRQYEFATSVAKMLSQSKRPVQPASIVASAYNAISLGLSLNPVKGEAYLVPYQGVCKLIPGYKGLANLMRNAGLKDIQGRVVYEGDEWDYYEDERGQHYKYKPTKSADRGEPEWAFSRAVLADGTISVFVMPYHKIEKIKQMVLARTPKSPWKDWPEEMAQKTVIRAHSKTLAMSDDVARAVHFDEKVEIGDASVDMPQELEEVLGAEVEVLDEQPEAPEVAPEQAPAADLDQKINGASAFLRDEEVEESYAAIEKASKKKRSEFGEKEKQTLAKELERRLDE